MSIYHFPSPPVKRAPPPPMDRPHWLGASPLFGRALRRQRRESQALIRWIIHHYGVAKAVEAQSYADEQQYE